MVGLPFVTIYLSELYGCQSSNSGELDHIPKQCQFATEVQHFTQVYKFSSMLSILGKNSRRQHFEIVFFNCPRK